MSTDTASQEYYRKVDIHDRQFQKYSIDHSIYLVPVDDEEEERLSQQHRIIHYVFDDKMFFPALQYPMRILDCGYGFGNWAVQMAQIYHQSQVTAIDIFPADLPDEPENLERQIWNLNHPLTPTYERDHYDLIHSRCVLGGIKKSRWSGYVSDLRRLVRRNGWVQLVEYHHSFQSQSGRLAEDSSLRKWSNYHAQAMGQLDRDPTVGGSLADKLRHAGLRDVQHRYYEVPIGSWPTDERQRYIGALSLENIDALLDSHALLPFTSRFGWTKQQVGWLTDAAKIEARDESLKLYTRLYVAWGRKR